MNIICPECHTPYESRKPIVTNRLTCKHCKTVFLTPIEAMAANIANHKDEFEAQKHRLKQMYRDKHASLDSEYKEALQQMDEMWHEAETFRKQAEEAGSEQRVKQPLSHKLIRAVLMSYFLVVFCVNGIMMFYQYQIEKHQILRDLTASETMFGPRLAHAVQKFDTAALSTALETMLAQPMIVGVRIENDRGDRVGAGGIFLNTAATPVMFQGDISVNVSDTPDVVTLKEQGISDLFLHTFSLQDAHSNDALSKTVGQVTVYSNKAFIVQRIKGGYALLWMNTFLVAAGLVGRLFWVTRKGLTRPLSVLTNAVASLNLNSPDSLEVEIKTTDRNELKILGETFNTMVADLVEKHTANMRRSKTFEKFIPRQFLSRVADEGIESIVLGDMGVEQLTILYCEIADYAELSKEIGAEEMFDYVNGFLSCVEVPIEKHGGFIYTFTNQGLAALFTLEDRPMEALSSVYAAVDMQKAMLRFNKTQKECKRPPLAITIGIETGDARLGTLGSENRMEPTAIGEAIEVATRLQHMNRRYQSQILLSERTFTLVESFQAFFWREVDSIKVQDDADPIRIFEVFDAEPVREIKEKLLEPFHEGLTAYRKKNWEKAIRSFEHCLTIYAMDAVSQLYLKRCETHKADTKMTIFLREESKLSSSLGRADDVGELVQEFEVVTFEDGDTIMQEGEPGTTFYIVLTGTCDIFISKDDGSEINVASRQRGDSFGEVSLLTGAPVSATIRSTGQSELLSLTREHFDEMIRKYPALNSYFHTRYSQYMADLQAAVLK